MEKPRKGSKGGRVAIYDESFKIAVASEYHIGSLSVLQLAQKHGLEEKTVYHFLRWYKHHQLALGVEPPLNTTSKDSISLANELAYAKLKITALELLISNAEREMGVDIRKKSGTKRPAK
ncbi:transposase [Pedobacter sp. ASV1-7]|uniref:transposase n=1 Tax=Pedobacter sp. ASV1-7 TaxID=3145237 RepID=UPI0032E886AF